jgi:ATP-dependent helicase/nuclease subunit B
MKPDLQCWGWDDPVLTKAVKMLLSRRKQTALDLSETLIIVPTAETARRLKEALARALAPSGAAMIPHIWPPSRALVTAQDRLLASTTEETLLVWAKVMSDLPIGDYPELFPKPPLHRSWPWAVEMGRAMADLLVELGAGGLGFAEVAVQSESDQDRDRWLELARLERLYTAGLKVLGRVDAQRLKQQRAAKPELPEGVREVIVLPSPDLPRLFKRWLDAVVAQGLPVQIWVQAAEGTMDRFDSHGAPRLASWGESARLLVPMRNEQLALEQDSSAQARRVVELLHREVPRRRTAVGICDPEVAVHLRDRLEHEGARSYEPGGQPAECHGTVQMFSTWVELLGADSWSAVQALLRVPALRWALIPAPPLVAQAVLAELDDFTQRRMPITLAHALMVIDDWCRERRQSEPSRWLREALIELHERGQAFGQQALPLAAREWLVWLYGDQQYLADSPTHKDHVQLCTGWLELCDTLTTIAERLGLKARPSDLLSLSIEQLKETRLSEVRGEIDLVLLGWLELLWESAPGLIIAGFNEEHVPGIQIAHPFLPDRLRETLGLSSQASRFARDSYLLSALAAQRQRTGCLEVLCGQWSDDRDTLRPSRLLFHCGMESLIHRVRQFFPRELESTLAKEPARTRPWRLAPRPVQREPLGRISASQLRSYLRCPFTYYLQTIVGMNAVDTTKAELDAMEFGDLMHRALVVLAGPSSQALGHHIPAIADQLIAAAEEFAHSRFSSHLPITLEIQLDSARQRLRELARLEAQNRLDGWQVELAEVSIGGDGDAAPLILAGARLRGRIDRVDRHRDGQLRIIDYKTSDKPARAYEAHLKDVSRAKLDPAEEWKTFLYDGKRLMWLDLQLPLYLAAWQSRTPERIECAYWNLPKAVESSDVSIFEGLTPDLVKAAIQCAEEAIRRINAGQFWPPAKGTNLEDWPGLVHGSVEESFDWGGQD